MYFCVVSKKNSTVEVKKQLFSFKSKLLQVQDLPKWRHEAKQTKQPADYQGAPRQYGAVQVCFWHLAIVAWLDRCLALLRLNSAWSHKRKYGLTWLLCSVCRDVLDKNKELFTEDVRESSLHVLTDMKQSAHAYLLKPVHDVLKVSFFTTNLFFLFLVNKSQEKTKTKLNVSTNS